MDRQDPGLHLAEDHEVLPDSEWLLACKRTTGRDDLLVYRHRVTGNFVLCHWVDRDKGIVQEIHAMETPPDRGGWMPLDWVRSRCRPAYEEFEEIQRMLRRARADKKSSRLEKAGARKDVSEHYRRRGEEGIAASVLAGNYDRTEEPDELEENLNRLASGRIITHG